MLGLASPGVYLGSSPHSPPLAICLPMYLITCSDPSCPRLASMPAALALVPWLGPQLDPLCRAPSPAMELSPFLPWDGTVLIPVPGSHPALVLQAQRVTGDVARGPGGGELLCWGTMGHPRGTLCSASPWEQGLGVWEGPGGAGDPVQGQHLHRQRVQPW